MLHLALLAVGIRIGDHFGQGNEGGGAESDVTRQPRDGFSLARLAMFCVIAAGLLVWSGVVNTVEVESRTMTGNQFVVTTWNVQRGYGAGWGTNMNRIADYINSRDMGIVGLQESEALCALLGQKDITHHIRSAVKQHSFYGNSPLLTSFDGAAILSPYPLSNCVAKHLTSTAIMPSFAATECVVRLSATRTIVVINAHPALIPLPDKRDHLAYIYSRALAANASGYPVVVLGDLNTAPNDPDMQPLLTAFPHMFSNASKYSKTSAKADGFPGYTRINSKSYIDYVLYSPGSIREVSSEILTDTHDLSDHLAVRTVLEFID